MALNLYHLLYHFPFYLCMYLLSSCAKTLCFTQTLPLIKLSYRIKWSPEQIIYVFNWLFCWARFWWFHCFFSLLRAIKCMLASILSLWFVIKTAADKRSAFIKWNFRIFNSWIHIIKVIRNKARYQSTFERDLSLIKIFESPTKKKNYYSHITLS